MKLQITSDEVPLKGTVEDLVNQHLGKDLEKVLRHFPEEFHTATVRVMKASRYGFKATFEMQLPGLKVYGVEKNEELKTALTRLRDEVKRQIRKHKEKQVGH